MNNQTAEPDPNTLVRAQALGRHYTVGRVVVPALDGVDFTVKRGEFLALVGPSGSGKSTLLNLIGALDRPSRGELWVNGVSLGKASELDCVRHRRERVGFIFQSFNLLPRLTALENVETPMTLAGVSKPERRGRARQLLDSVGLANRAGHRSTELSGGERQRVAIARALANHPQLLLADEPTGNLDSRTGAIILELLGQLLSSRQLTLIIVTHDLGVASLADRVIHLQDGRINRVETRVKAPQPEAREEIKS
jgi:putative ABC transport system ATP-binding protein